MQIARRAALRTLTVTIIAALVLPAVLFAYAAWVAYRHASQAADARIALMLDVVHEHALKVFESVDLIFLQVEGIVRGQTDVELRAQEEVLHFRLRQIDAAVTEIASIWLFDRKGQTVATSLTYPVPPIDVTARDYFAAQAERDAGIYIGSIVVPRLADRQSFIGVSKRLPSPDGAFNGVAQVSVPPANFERFYSRIGQQPGMTLSMVRSDGVVLARSPPGDAPARRLGPESGFRRLIAGSERGGHYTAVSQLDGRERRFGVRKLAGHPVYLTAAMETAAIRGEWLATLGSHLVFGVPATALLCLTLLVARRRTETLYAEAERREAAEAALRQAQRMEAIGQLTGGVAHDFNNLLMVISGSVRRLQKQPHDPALDRHLEMIGTAAKRGETLTRQLLSYARRQTLSPEVIDLSVRLPELRDLLRRSLRGDIEVVVAVADGDCRVKVDPAELELALLNIAVNARDAMPQGGTLTVTVARAALGGEAAVDGLTGRFAALSIADTGGGIAADVLPRVFEPFFTTKELGKGTGLGLSQVYGFAKQSGGTAAIRTSPAGTTVTLYLPYTTERPAMAPVPAAAPPTGGGRTVLLVEDNAEVAEICRAYLDQLGFRCVQASSGADAMEVLRNGTSVDIVLSDILMPGSMNGLELARAARRLRPGLPVILATGYSSSADEAAREGFTVLRKPFDLEAVERALRGLRVPAG